MGRAAVVIPALNEAGQIGELVRAIALVTPPAGLTIDTIVVADNGSTDATASAAAAAGALVVHESRRGYGFACAAGTKAALAANARVIVFMDGDFSSLPDELPTLLAPLATGRADLVLGSRTKGNIVAGAMPPHQRLGNWFCSQLMALLYRMPVSDLGPFRAIRTDLLQRLEMSQMTFGWPAEMMVKAASLGARIVEVPVSWHLRRTGRSKVGGSVIGSLLAAYHIIAVTLRYRNWSSTVAGRAGSQ